METGRQGATGNGDASHVWKGELLMTGLLSRRAPPFEVLSHLLVVSFGEKREKE